MTDTFIRKLAKNRTASTEERERALLEFERENPPITSAFPSMEESRLYRELKEAVDAPAKKVLVSDRLQAYYKFLAEKYLDILQPQLDGLLNDLVLLYKAENMKDQDRWDKGYSKRGALTKPEFDRHYEFFSSLQTKSQMDILEERGSLNEIISMTPSHELFISVDPSKNEEKEMVLKCHVFAGVVGYYKGVRQVGTTEGKKKLTAQEEAEREQEEAAERRRREEEEEKIRRQEEDARVQEEIKNALEVEKLRQIKEMRIIESASAADAVEAKIRRLQNKKNKAGSTGVQQPRSTGRAVPSIVGGVLEKNHHHRGRGRAASVSTVGGTPSTAGGGAPPNGVAPDLLDVVLKISNISKNLCFKIKELSHSLDVTRAELGSFSFGEDKVMSDVNHSYTAMLPILERITAVTGKIKYNARLMQDGIVDYTRNRSKLDEKYDKDKILLKSFQGIYNFFEKFENVLESQGFLSSSRQDCNCEGRLSDKEEELFGSKTLKDDIESLEKQVVPMVVCCDNQSAFMSLVSKWLDTKTINKVVVGVCPRHYIELVKHPFLNHQGECLRVGPFRYLFLGYDSFKSQIL